MAFGTVTFFNNLHDNLLLLKDQMNIETGPMKSILWFFSCLLPLMIIANSPYEGADGKIKLNIANGLWAQHNFKFLGIRGTLIVIIR